MFSLEADFVDIPIEQRSEWMVEDCRCLDMDQTIHE
jgi:hypothetical protein